MNLSKEEKKVLLACFKEQCCSTKGVALWSKLDQKKAAEVLKILVEKNLVYSDKTVYLNGDDSWELTEQGEKAVKQIQASQ